MNAQSLTREYTEELLGITEDLPTLPDRFLKIQHIINNPDAGAADIAKIVETDQATTVMVMKVANSPVYNPTNKSIASLSQAIARLGLTETAEIALSMSLLYGFAIPCCVSAIRAFWTHAYAVGLLCKHITRQLRDHHHELPHYETMFLAGLLHDIGKAILGIRVDLSYFETSELRTYGDSLITAETKHYGMNHGEVGGHILSRWHMADEIVQTVSGYHNNGNYIGAKICAIADEFAHQHMDSSTSIEMVNATLADGMYDKVDAVLREKGLLPPLPESSETTA